MEHRAKARVLAFYLPQFHPIPENDRWWGKGFTEWTNVGKARKYYPGHYQPRVPADLGYYDLRVPEVREAQAQLAKAYGIEGFIYWHYWFGNGRRLLERPFNEVVESGKPDFPFALAWANESWSGTFHGLKKGKMLIEQIYGGEGDIKNHFYAVLKALKDRRYITCEGKPLFFIYNPEGHPDIRNFMKTWQGLARENGLPGICFVGVCSDMYTARRCAVQLEKYRDFGVSFLNTLNQFGVFKYPLWFRLLRKIFYEKLHMIPNVRPYEARLFQSPVDGEEDVIPCLCSNWDHTPRTGKRGLVMVGNSPRKFQEILQGMVERIAHKPYEKRFLTIKSWNEWAEGNYLEPDLRYGHQYLQAVKNVVLGC